MKIVFRVDSSYRIGSGHLMRCITLADRLRNESVELSFVCRDHDGHMSQLARDAGYQVEMLPAGDQDTSSKSSTAHSDWLGVSMEQDADQTMRVLSQVGPLDWLIVDHYALDAKWESTMRSIANRILVIDDLADREHDCDILLDQNLNESLGARYQNLVPDNCVLLCGPKHALLRSQFLSDTFRAKERGRANANLLIFFGGVDATGETLKACRALISLSDCSATADVIAGPSNPHFNEIREFCKHHLNITHYSHVDNMAELMAKADLAIGAGGTTTWERAWLGLPTIIIVVADNQIEGAQAMHKAGAVWNLGMHSCVDEATLAGAIRTALDDPVELDKKRKASLAIFGKDPKPGIELVVNAIMERNHATA